MKKTSTKGSKNLDTPREENKRLPTITPDELIQQLS